MKKHEYFTVQGKPFFSIGGQVHNSSGYAIGAENGEAYERDAERSFESLRALGANTAAIPVCWDAFEPEEGKFNFGYVKRIIDAGNITFMQFCSGLEAGKTARWNIRLYG